MAQTRRIKFTIHHSKRVTKIIACTAIVLAIIALAALHICMQRIERKTEEMNRQAAALQKENDDISQRIDSLDTVQGIEKVAEDELGLVPTDAIIIDTDEVG